jgi:hypothetical protein
LPKNNLGFPFEFCRQMPLADQPLRALLSQGELAGN